MKIGNREIGYGHPTFIIAECCSNIVRHISNANEYALRVWADEVKRAGADALKVQLYRADHFPEAERDHKRRTEFPRDLFPLLVEICRQWDMLCGASVFDDEAVDLCEASDADFLKLATREWDNQELLRKCLLSSKPVFRSYDISKKELLALGQKVTYLACVPQYPSVDPLVPGGNDQDWGWSSHTADWLDCLLAVSQGACVVEKHFKLSDADYEAGWSLDPAQFRQMVKDIRRVERMR